MKVHELITILNKKPAGANVRISKYNPRSEDIDYFEIVEVGGGDDEGENVYIDQGKKTP